MNQQNQKLPGLLGVIPKFMVKLTSIMAAISVTLSATGFLILRSNANLLGLSSFLHHSVGDYLYEGARFFISTLWVLTASITRNLYWWTIVVSIAAALYLLRVRFRLFQRIAKKLELADILQRSWIRCICIVLAVFLLLLCTYRVLPSTEARDLLFAASDHQEITKRATEESIENLKSRYANSFLYITISIIILWGISKIHHDPEKESASALLCVYSRYTARQLKTPEKAELFSAIGRLFLYLLFIVELTLVPINYGQSIHSNDFHKVKDLFLEEKLEGKIPRSENCWLLYQNAEEFVLYFGDTAQVLLVSKEQVLSIAIGERCNIFVGR